MTPTDDLGVVLGHQATSSQSYLIGIDDGNVVGEF